MKGGIIEGTFSQHPSHGAWASSKCPSRKKNPILIMTAKHLEEKKREEKVKKA